MGAIRYLNALCFSVIFLPISHSTFASSATVEDGCLAFSKIAEQIAIMRDEQQSELQVLSELKAKTGMNATFAQKMILSVFYDLGQLTPDAIQYVYNDFCLKKDGDILVQSFDN